MEKKENKIIIKDNKIIISDSLRLFEKQKIGNCILLLSDVQHKYNENDFYLSSDSINVINKIVEREVIKVASENYKNCINSLYIARDNFELDCKRDRINREITGLEKSLSHEIANFDNKIDDLKFKTLLFKISSIISIITIFLLTLNIF